MVRQKEHKNSARIFWDRITLLDVGIGVLYFFASHMVIRALYYIGVDRSSQELSLFFLIVVGAIIVAHLLARPLLKLRRSSEAYLGIPAVSAVAALGAVLALLSMLPTVAVELFYASGALFGLACGWIVVIWTSTINNRHPEKASFHLDTSLAVAVVVYFLFRVISTPSETISQGFLLALPLVALFFITQSYRINADKGIEAMQETAQSLQVLVIVAAVFALGCSVTVSYCGLGGDFLSSGLNHMVLFEVLAVALMAFCCWVMYRFSEQAATISPRLTLIVCFCVVYVPAFLFGLMMGGAGIPDPSPSALWESNVWVLIIVIFAYDIRDSLFAIRGLAVGLMFETMCVGQLIARISVLDSLPYALPLALALAALYFVSICWQLSRARSHSGSVQENNARVSSSGGNELCCAGVSGSEASTGEKSSEKSSSTAEGEMGSSRGMHAACCELASLYGLTPREAEILGHMAMGRSAKYIAEELTVSHNTTRTHFKHIYEKLNIHSKQDLIDLVHYSSGYMPE